MPLKSQIQKTLVYRLYREKAVPWLEEGRHRRIIRWYPRSPYPDRIRMMRDRHDGARCFIIGNGPSLSPADLSRLTGEITFSTNYITRLFPETSWRPYYYMLSDLFCSLRIDARTVPCETALVGMEKNPSLIRKYRNTDGVVLYLKRTALRDGLFPEANGNLEDYVSSGHTTLFEACEWAMYFGCTTLILLGCDCDYQGKDLHFYKDSQQSRAWVNPDEAEKMQFAWSAIKEYADAHGVKVLNATRGGRLEIFERVDFDSLF